MMPDMVVVFSFFSETHEFSMTSNAEAVSLPPIDGLNPRPVQLPMAIPKDLADR